jgi:putative ABC transport system permease protein
MKIVAYLRSLISAFFHRDQLDAELHEEFRTHIAQHASDLERSGISRPEAERQARIAFGSHAKAVESSREQLPGIWLETFVRDLRFALRMLSKNHGFTFVAIPTLALGIGATTAVFSVVDRVLFRSLPYPHDERLVSFGVKAPFESIEFMLAPEYVVLRSQASPFESMTSLTPGGSDCDITEQNPLRLNCAAIEANFLSTFDIHPIVGRDFTREDDLPEARRVALLSYSLWRSRFGGDPKVAGKLVSLDGTPVEIIGVLPASFEMPTLTPVDLLVPQALDVAALDRTHPQLVLRAFARLKPAVTIAQATAALQPWYQDSLHFVPPQFRAEVSLAVRSLRDRQTDDSRVAAWILFAAVIAVLLLACTNVANLLLVRAVGRQRELAVRAALGAGRARLIRQTLTESLLLALLGGVAGCALAYGLLRVLISIAPQGILHLQQASLDLRVLGFSLFLSLTSGLFFGVVPALGKPAPESLVGRTARATTQSVFRHTLIATQIAGSLVLLCGAGLLLRSLWKIQSVPVGLQPQHLVTAEISLATYRYPDAPQQLAFYRELEARLSRIPGIEQVALSDSLPPSGRMQATFFASIDVPGRPRPAEGTGGMVGFRMVSPNYFQILDIPIIRGRSFTEADCSPAERPVIISQALAEKMFPNEDPVGKSLRFTTVDSQGPFRNIVGIAANVKNNGLTSASDPEFYIPWKNDSEASVRHAYVTFRATLTPATTIPWARSFITELDPTIPVEIVTMNARVGALTQRPRFDAMLLSLFAAIALLLAAIGIFGVVSFFVSQRTQEIGLRMALGATPFGISKLVLLNILRWSVAGAAFGLLGSWFCARMLQSLLFDVRAHDPMLFAAAILILTAVALFAAWIPARKAAQVDPIVALRYE